MMVILEVVRQETRKGEEQKLGMVQHTGFTEAFISVHIRPCI